MPDMLVDVYDVWLPLHVVSVLHPVNAGDVWLHPPRCRRAANEPKGVV